MIEIYETWVERLGIDGFRIDTVKHVNMEFWQQFAPGAARAAQRRWATTTSSCSARSSTPTRAFMSRYTTEGGLQATLDFGFQASGAQLRQAAVPTTRAARPLRRATTTTPTPTPTRTRCRRSSATTTWAASAASSARHNADADDAELLARDQLAHSLMYLTRGQPVVYYGDEQGFVGDAGAGLGDQRARQDMFPSQVASYNDDDLIGTDATTADAELRPGPPAVPAHRRPVRAARGAPGAGRRRADPPLRERAARASSPSAGSTPRTRSSTSSPSTTPTRAEDGHLRHVQRAHARSGACGRRAPRTLKSDSEGRVTVTVPPLSAVVWQAATPLEADRRRAGAVLPHPGAPGHRQRPRRGRRVGARWRLQPGDLRLAAGRRRRTGRSSAPTTTRRTACSTTSPASPQGTPVEYRAIVRDHDGDLGVAGDLRRRRRARAADRRRRRRRRPGRAAGRGLGARQPQQRDRAAPARLGSPPCDQAQLTLDPTTRSGRARYDLPAGEYAFKAAINRSWDENYGAGGVRDGSDISVHAPAADR